MEYPSLAITDPSSDQSPRTPLLRSSSGASMFLTTMARRSLMNGTARAVSITSASIVFDESNVVTFASRRSGVVIAPKRSSRALETANSSSPHITRIMTLAYLTTYKACSQIPYVIRDTPAIGTLESGHPQVSHESRPVHSSRRLATVVPAPSHVVVRNWPIGSAP